MSAFVVSPLHINTLVSWAAKHRVNYIFDSKRHEIQDKAELVAATLYAENVRSVNTHYNESEPTDGFVFRQAPIAYVNLPAIAIIKACNCLEYQSCETSDWEKTEAFAILEAIKSDAVRHVDGYGDADWAIA